MGMFDLKGGSTGNNWNYHDNTKQNYLEMIEGTVVEISNPQARNFNTGKPDFWPDGNPKRNLMVTIRGRSGNELNWIFGPKSVAANACLKALDPQDDRDQVSIEELLGKFVRVQTQGGVYNAQHPRPWWVTIIGDGEVNMVRGLKDLSQQVAAAPAMPQPQAQPMQQTPPPPQPVAEPTPLQQAQAAAQHAVAQQNFQQANPAPQMNPAEQFYSEDIPF